MMENFADIEGPVRIGITGLIIWGAVGLAALALLAFLIRRIVRSRRRAAAEAPVIRQSALDRAMERLIGLRTRMGGIEAEPFTVEVSDVVRDYLEAALRIPAREQTSEEFLSALQADRQSPRILRETMPDFLVRCDQVKFARQSLAGDQMARLLDTAESVVREVDRDVNREPAPESPEPAASPAP